MSTNGIEVQYVKTVLTCIPVTDVGVTYEPDQVCITLTLPGYMNKAEILRHLKRICKHRTLYEYRSHGWRNAIVERSQRNM
jgi:hypothetical protein